MNITCVQIMSVKANPSGVLNRDRTQLAAFAINRSTEYHRFQNHHRKPRLFSAARTELDIEINRAA